jgi:hypothetical protein
MMEIGLLYSMKCTAACRHCGTSCSPKTTEKMELSQALRVIREAATIPDVGKIVFTGGEPLLFYKDIKHLIGEASKLGLATRLVTNAYWAGNSRVAIDKLRPLVEVGLNEVNVSADHFHQEFIPVANIRHALDAIHELALLRIVARVVSRTSKSLEAFINFYGFPREDCLDYELVPRRDIYALRNPDSPLYATYLNKIIIRSAQILPAGAASQHPLEWFREPIDSFDSPCDEMLNRPGLYPDGSLIGCCCAAGRVQARD